MWASCWRLPTIGRRRSRTPMKTRHPSRKALKLPEFLRPLFCDYRFDSLSWEQDADLITGRVLAAGEWDAITWLWRRLTDEKLREWLIANEGGDLNPAQLRFWEIVLDLPRRQVNDWLKRPG